MEKSGKQVVEFRFELETAVDGRNRIERSLLKALQRESPSLSQSYERALIDVGFRYYAKGQLRTGRKLSRLVDERYSNT